MRYCTSPHSKQRESWLNDLQKPTSEAKANMPKKQPHSQFKLLGGFTVLVSKITTQDTDRLGKTAQKCVLQLLSMSFISTCEVNCVTIDPEVLIKSSSTCVGLLFNHGCQLINLLFDFVYAGLILNPTNQ